MTKKYYKILFTTIFLSILILLKSNIAYAYNNVLSFSCYIGNDSTYYQPGCKEYVRFKDAEQNVASDNWNIGLPEDSAISPYVSKACDFCREDFMKEDYYKKHNYEDMTESAKASYKPKDSSNGEYMCAQYGIQYINDVWGERVYTDEYGTSGTRAIYLYDAARIDIWGGEGNIDDRTHLGSGGYYYVNSSFGNNNVVTFPGMDLSYESIEDIPDNVKEAFNNIEGAKNLRLTKVKKIDYDNDFMASELRNSNTQSWWEKWRVRDFDIQKTGDGSKFSYQVDIRNLSSNNNKYRTGFSEYYDYKEEKDKTDINLGYYADAEKEIWIDNERFESDPRTVVYHYWLPYVAIFEYDLEDDEIYRNPCVDGVWENGVQVKSSQKYAYENPGVCCIEYSETCCAIDDLNTLDEYVMTNTSYADLKQICCHKDEVLDYENDRDPFGVQLDGLKTFKANPNTYSRNYNKYCDDDDDDDDGYCSFTDTKKPNCCIYDKYANDPRCTCLTANDYQPGSYCCTNGRLKNVYESKCNPPENNSCDDSEYFNNHKLECCDEISESKFEEDDNKQICCSDGIKENLNNNKSLANSVCPNTKSNLLCKKPYYEIPKTETENGVRTKETINIDKKETGNESIIKSVNSGQGFKYNLTVTDTIELTMNVNMSYSYCQNLEEQYNKYIKTESGNIGKLEYEYNEMKDNFVHESKNVTSDYTLNGGNGERNYKIINLDESSLDINNVQNKAYKTIKSSKTCKDLDDSYDVCYTNIEGEEVCTTKYRTKNFLSDYMGISGDVTYLSSLKNTITYELELEDCYLKYGDENRTCESNKSSNPNYYNAGSKYYVPMNQKNGYFDLNVAIQNAGLGNNIKSTGDGYTCEGNNFNPFEGVHDPDPNDSTVTPNKSEYIFRPISLKTPFPNRNPGTNWQGYDIDNKFLKVNTYITGTSTNPKGDTVYGDSMYTIKLTPSLITAIKNYNNEEEKNNKGGYLDWVGTMKVDSQSVRRTSNFLSCLAGNSGLCPDSLRSANTYGAFVSIPNDTKRKNKIGDFENNGAIGVN